MSLIKKKKNKTKKIRKNYLDDYFYPKKIETNNIPIVFGIEFDYEDILNENSNLTHNFFNKFSNYDIYNENENSSKIFGSIVMIYPQIKKSLANEEINIINTKIQFFKNYYNIRNNIFKYNFLKFLWLINQDFIYDISFFEIILKDFISNFNLYLENSKENGLYLDFINKMITYITNYTIINKQSNDFYKYIINIIFDLIKNGLFIFEIIYLMSALIFFEFNIVFEIKNNKIYTILMNYINNDCLFYLNDDFNTLIVFYYHFLLFLEESGDEDLYKILEELNNDSFFYNYNWYFKHIIKLKEFIIINSKILYFYINTNYDCTIIDFYLGEIFSSNTNFIFSFKEFLISIIKSNNDLFKKLWLKYNLIKILLESFNDGCVKDIILSINLSLNLEIYEILIKRNYDNWIKIHKDEHNILEPIIEFENNNNLNYIHKIIKFRKKERFF